MAEILKSKITIADVIKLVVFLIGMTSSGIAYYWSNKNTQLEFEYKVMYLTEKMESLEKDVELLKNKK